MPDVEDSCPICYDDMHNVAETSLVFCEECGNAVHKECFGECELFLHYCNNFNLFPSDFQGGKPPKKMSKSLLVCIVVLAGSFLLPPVVLGLPKADMSIWQTLLGSTPSATLAPVCHFPPLKIIVSDLFHRLSWTQGNLWPLPLWGLKCRQIIEFDLHHMTRR
jgi:hypothetical protein